MTRQHRTALGLVSLAVAFGLGYAMRASAGGIPATGALSYAGVIQNGSGPLTGTHTIGVSFLTAASGGTLLCSASAAVAVTNGYFSVPLPDTCTTAVGGNPNIWVDVTVDGADTGTTKIGAVPYAVEGNHAVSADNASDAGTLGSTLASLQSSVTTLQGSSTSESSSISTLQSDMTAAQSNITTLQGDVTGIDSSLVARVAGVNATLPGLTGNVNGSKTQLLFEGGTSVQTTNSSGDITVDFPGAFPSGVVSVAAVAGETATGTIEVTTWSVSSFTVHSAVTSGLIRVNWVAVGW